MCLNINLANVLKELYDFFFCQSQFVTYYNRISAALIVALNFDPDKCLLETYKV